MKRLFAIILGDSHLGVKVGSSFGLLIVILLSVGWVGIRQLHRVDQELADMVNQHWQKVQLSRKAQNLSNINNRLTMQVFLVNETEIKALMAERGGNSKEISQLIETLRSKVESQEEEGLLDALEKKRTPYTDSYKSALRTLVDDKNPDAARAVMVQQALPRLIEYHNAWNAYVDYQGHQMDLAKKGNAVSGAATRETTVLLTAFGVLFAIAIAIFVTRNITWHMKRRKRADEALRQAHDESEEKVRGRTAELANANAALEAEISERKQAEAGLRETEERYRDLFENANDIIYTHDLQGYYTSVNKACAGISGYTAAETLGMNASQIVAPEYLEMVKQMTALKSANHATSAYELEIIAKNGNRVTLEVNSRLICHDGKPAGVQGIARDITERKRAEADIRGLQEFQAAIISGVQHGIQGIDKAGRIAFENPIAAGMLGWDLNELIGKPAHATMHHHRADKSCYPAEDCNIYATLHDDQPRHILDEVFWRQDGTSFPVEYSVAPMHGASGEVTGTVVVFDDITERKRSELERQVISEIVQSVIATASLDELLNLVHVSIGKLLPAENCFVALYDKTSDQLHIPFCKDEFDEVASSQRLGRGLTAFVLRSGRPMLLTPELIQELVLKGEIELVGTLPAAWLGVPLRTSADIIGVLVVQHYEDKDAYSQQDLELLASVADQLGLAIERKQMEIELKTNGMQLNAAQQIAHIGSWEWDAVNKKLHWSEELFRIFGLQPREFGPKVKEFFAHLHPEDLKLVKGAIKQALRHGVVPSFDFRIVLAEQTVRVLQINGEAVVDETGRFIRMWGTIQDITERKRSENESDVISEVIQSVNLTSNLDELLKQAHQSIKRVLYAQNICVALFDKQTGLFEAPLFVDLAEANPFPLAPAKTVISKVFNSGQPLLMDGAIFAELVARGEVVLMGRPSPSYLAVPLMTPAEMIGVMVVQHYEKENVYSQRDVEFLSAVAAQLALAIERKRAEAALAKSEKRYRELIDNGLGLICTHDLDGKLLSVNPAAAESLGYTPAEMEGRNLIEYISPSAQPVFPHYLKRIAADGHLTGLLNLLTRKGEEQIWMYRNSRIADPGAEAYVLGFAQDVTVSRRAEEALVESDRRFRDLFYDAPVGYHELDTEGRITCVNTTELSMLGYSEAEMIGRQVWDFIEEPEIARQTFADKIAGNKPLRHVERSFRRKDGTLMDVQLDDQMLKDPGGRTIGIRATMQDIGERKRTEAALMQSEQRFRDLFENASDLVCTMDLEGNFTSLNKSGERLTGYRQSEAVEMNVAQIVTPEALDLIQEMMKRKLGRDITTTYEIDVIRKGGGTVTLELSSRLLRQQGKETGIQAIGRDITQRKQAEAELRLARDMALESVRLKSEFLANMSHEIRTPMNGVIGMTGLLLDTDLDEEQRDCAETIRASGEGLLTIINDILDFSKFEAGKLQFETIDFLLNNAVEDTIELLAERAHQKKIELASLIYSEVPTELRGDPGRLRQVLTNLIGNAIKFTERGEVVVRVEKVSETNDEVVVRFVISDTGIGISEAAQQNLFQPFVQADGSTTRKYGGTGLGLAISKQLVELMGGEMGVTSTPGQGSTFWFTARYDKQAASGVLPQPQIMSLEKLRVLIVDDNATNRKILSHQLGSWGMIHQEADSGFEALKLICSAAAAGAPYDLAVLDLMMPGMDGFKLARTIKSDPCIAGMHLVMLTSFGERGHAAMAREAGVAAYLTKPVRQSQLFDCLANVISAAVVTPEPDNASSQPGPQLLTKHTLKETRMNPNKLILIAEDNIVNQKVAIRQLQKLGYRADAVANGREAIEALGRISYDLVLMDCQMPEMDGYEATAEIRRREVGSASRTIVIAMTAHALEGDREKCIAAGMDDYITKPVKPEALKEVLERFLSSSIADAADTETAAADASPVDMERLREALGDDPESVSEILTLYIDDMSTGLDRMEIALQSSEHKEIESIAHNCAGTSANCGMTAVVASLRELETAGRSNDLTNAAAAVAEAKKEFQRVQAYLIEHVMPAAPLGEAL